MKNTTHDAQEPGTQIIARALQVMFCPIKHCRHGCIVLPKLILLKMLVWLMQQHTDWLLADLSSALWLEIVWMEIAPMPSKCYKRLGLRLHMGGDWLKKAPASLI